MNPQTYNKFIEIVRRKTGIVLGPDKQYLVESRLRPVAETSGIPDVDSLLQTIFQPGQERLQDVVVDAMTTNETFFFRDDAPFKSLAETLPELAERRRGAPIRIWSAASSTGQEPYSLAIIAQEVQDRHPKVKVDIIGTDISDRCLTKARAGIYSQFEVQRGVSMRRLATHFEQVGPTWQVKRDLRAMVSWRKVNLLDNTVGLGRMDIIFCRNVLIYFSAEDRKRILERLATQVADDGLVFLGGSENVVGVTTTLEPADKPHALRPTRSARVPLRASM